MVSKNSKRVSTKRKSVSRKNRKSYSIISTEELDDPTVRYIFNERRLKTNGYMIKDNGNSSFYVEVFPKEIFIYVLSNIEYTDDILPKYYKYKLFKIVKNYKKVFIGEDSRYGRWGKGNSILINIKDNEYMSIGFDIFTFCTNEEIIKYKSPIENTDVPNTVAYTKNYAYLLLAGVYFPRYLSQNKNEYGVYYGNVEIDPPFDKDKVKKIKSKLVHGKVSTRFL